MSASSDIKSLPPDERPLFVEMALRLLDEGCKCEQIKADLEARCKSLRDSRIWKDWMGKECVEEENARGFINFTPEIERSLRGMAQGWLSWGGPTCEQIKSDIEAANPKLRTDVDFQKWFVVACTKEAKVRRPHEEPPRKL